MRQYDFEMRHQDFWQAFEDEVAALEKRRYTGSAQHFTRRYRIVCHHLSQATSRDYSATLVENLQKLVERAHHVLYRNKENALTRLAIWLRSGLPQAVRAEKTVMIWAHVLFYVPYAVFFLLCALYPEWLGKIFGTGTGWQVDANFRKMMGQASAGIKRDIEWDVFMFGYYVMNNIGIAFQALGGGLLFGVGTIWMLVFNGIMTGGVSGYMLHSEAAPAFFGFIGAHSAFELTGIVIAGAAGLRVGLALINPQGYSRADALKIQGKGAGLLMAAAFVLLLIAAAIEAFWSSLTVLPHGFKMAIALCLWLAVYGYLLFAGRGRA